MLAFNAKFALLVITHFCLVFIRIFYLLHAKLLLNMILIMTLLITACLFNLFLGFIEMLVHKKLDKIDNSLNQTAIDTKIKETNRCAEPEDAYPVPSLQIQISKSDRNPGKVVG